MTDVEQPAEYRNLDDQDRLKEPEWFTELHGKEQGPGRRRLKDFFMPEQRDD